MRPRSTRRAAVVVFGAGAALSAGCPKPGPAPTPPSLPPFAAPVEAAGACTVRGVAVAPSGDGRVIAAFGHEGAITIAGASIPALAAGAPDTSGAGPAPASASGAGGDTATITLVPQGGGKPSWSRSIAGAAGPVALAPAIAVAVVGATGTIDLDGHPMAVRGAPGALAIGVDPATGATRWAQGLGATEWVTASAATALPGGDVAIAGSFAGTLRVGGAVVASAGSSDGFVARLGPGGEVRWLVRLGGPYADAVTGVAAAGDRVAIAGTFTGDLDLGGGQALAAIQPDTVLPDGFVAMLGGDGRIAWARRFGSAQDDQVAGVAVTRSGKVAVAATVRDVTYVGAGAANVTAGGVEDWNGHGIADAMVAVWDEGGEPVDSALLGGADYDGARAIAARGDELVVAGWFSGAAGFAGETVHAGGGDDAFVALLDDRAHVLRVSTLTGDGREDVPALAAAPTGWAAGLAFTAAATLDGDHFASPADPDGGCALVFRPR